MPDLGQAKRSLANARDDTILYKRKKMGIPPCSSKRLINALKKVGLGIDPSAGDGSHTKIIDLKTGHSTTVPKSSNLSFVRNEIVKWAVKLGYSEEEIKKNL